jgi:hypothetical protein
MSEKTTKFIKTIGVLAQNEYNARKKAILPSVCIAQAALESGWNLAAKSLFGIKGNGFKATTSEFYNGHYIQIEDSFRAYPNVAAAVVGYYDFLEKTPRYAGALNNSNYKDTVDKLIHTTDGAPYATDPNYISKIISIIEQYNLTIWDNKECGNQKSIEELADEVIAGKWGNDPERRNALVAAGYDAAAVQQKVNEKLGVKNATNQKSIEELADEVIAGKWGNDPERKNALAAAGYDAAAVQRRVNEKLK